VTLVYAYGIVLPILLWIALRYLGVGEWSVVEAIAVWGYAMFVWIPVSVRIRLIVRYGIDIIDIMIADTVRHTCANRTMGSGWCSLCAVRLLLGSECISHPRIRTLFSLISLL